jgi:hypothetical protein
MSRRRVEGDVLILIVPKRQTTIHTKGDFLMKRILVVLVASMFLASAAYAAEEKKATEKAADSKVKGDENRRR